MSEPLYPVDSFEDRLVDQMDRRGEITSFFMETLLPLLPTNEIKVHIPSVPGLRAVYKLVGQHSVDLKTIFALLDKVIEFWPVRFHGMAVDFW